MNCRTLVVSYAALVAVAALANMPETRATVRLVDGSTVVGTAKTESIRLSTSFGDLAVPIDKIKSLEISTPANIKSQEISKTGGSGILPLQKDGLVYHCTFDSAAAVASPAAGPSGKFNRGTFVPGRVGNALRLRKGERDAVVVDFPADSIPARGTIEFWAKIEDEDDAYEVCGNPIFFRLQGAVGPWLDMRITENNGGGLYGLCGQAFGLIGCYQGSGLRSYSHLLGDAHAWHHYAMTWGIDNAIYLDGLRVASLHGAGPNIVRAPGHTFRLHVNWDDQDRFPNPDAFQIDDLKIWNRNTMTQAK